MIRVTVALLSAISADRSTELARMDLCNDGHRTVEDPRKGTYLATTYRGRDSATLDKRIPSKSVEVANWPRNDLHVWNLIRAALDGMGYTQSRGNVRCERRPEVVPVCAGYRRPVAMSGGDLSYEYVGADTPPHTASPFEGWEPLYTFRIAAPCA